MARLFLPEGLQLVVMLFTAYIVLNLYHTAPQAGCAASKRHAGALQAAGQHAHLPHS